MVHIVDQSKEVDIEITDNGKVVKVLPDQEQLSKYKMIKFEDLPQSVQSSYKWVFATDKEYFECAHFDKSFWSGINEHHL